MEHGLTPSNAWSAACMGSVVHTAMAVGVPSNNAGHKQARMLFLDGRIKVLEGPTKVLCNDGAVTIPEHQA
jgi:hypothetical protein